ncbi:hypothetical protein [Peterkaempfera bronchialis]|uniref:Uncharacterized protein n=1 Tax=Peterkaempfera bronchialis TaxID=2126346 RepID=A0A345SUW1_9ACTN|nr:hypothetical protein [Peterkaempfera bronchialis]AXI77516.1 hypothetical protein C7M71_008735 [Peterkaempfera bronchialis]
MNDHAHPVRRLLVLPDRDAAEEVAAEVGRRWPALGEPELVREALAGEDDAEDAQWLVVLDQPAAVWTADLRDAVDALAAEHDGWGEEG